MAREFKSIFKLPGHGHGKENLKIGYLSTAILVLVTAMQADFFLHRASS